MPHSRQIFTLFHELAHLLFRTGGIDLRSKFYIDKLKGNNKRIEILCNKFAGAFLVPDADFAERIVGIQVNDKSITELVSRYHVSREVILRKLLDRDLVSQKFYGDKVEEWANAKPKKPKHGGDPYLTKGVYLGYRYLEMAFRRYYQRKINIDQLANYLGFKKIAAVGEMESVFQKRAISK